MDKLKRILNRLKPTKKRVKFIGIVLAILGMLFLIWMDRRAIFPDLTAEERCTQEVKDRAYQQVLPYFYSFEFVDDPSLEDREGKKYYFEGVKALYRLRGSLKDLEIVEIEPEKGEADEEKETQIEYHVYLQFKVHLYEDEYHKNFMHGADSTAVEAQAAAVLAEMEKEINDTIVPAMELESLDYKAFGKRYQVQTIYHLEVGEYHCTELARDPEYVCAICEEEKRLKNEKLKEWMAEQEKIEEEERLKQIEQERREKEAIKELQRQNNTTKRKKPNGTGYLHPDDFYEDHFDDFESYEDAESYWDDQEQ